MFKIVLYINGTGITHTLLLEAFSDLADGLKHIVEISSIILYVLLIINIVF
jgi:hypothetical protein